MQKESNKVLVIDVGNPSLDDKLHDREALENVSHTLLPIYELTKRLEVLGVECVTPNQVLAGRFSNDDRELLLASHLTNERTPRLLSSRVKPFLLFCQESPMIATRFYLNFRRLSKPFINTMAFSGMKKRAHPGTHFIPMHFPIYFGSIDVPKKDFSEKKLLALVAGNKSAPAWKAILTKLYYGGQVRLIYPVRKRLVEGLATRQAIDLYGKGWDTDAHEAVRSCCRGLIPAGEKHQTLANYKFTLCFENAIFPGYVTEKIFDAILAGSVPVYLGDPNILDTVPREVFVDARTHGDAEKLHHHLAAMPEDEYHARLKAGKEFLASAAFKHFDHETFIEKVIGLLKSYGQQS